MRNAGPPARALPPKGDPLTDTRRLRIAVLLSGNGSSLENLFEHIETRGLPAEIAVVVSSKVDAFGLERARRRDVPAIAVPRKQTPDVDEFNDALHRALEAHPCDLVCLLGFLSPFQLRGRYEGRALNVHPSLIPAFAGKGFYGARVHRAVLEAGVKVSGATVHFVDEAYDEGPIVCQEAVPVLEDDTVDTLAARVVAAERRLVPQAIRWIAEGRVEIDGRRTRIAGAPSAGSE